MVRRPCVECGKPCDGRRRTCSDECLTIRMRKRAMNTPWRRTMVARKGELR